MHLRINAFTDYPVGKHYRLSSDGDLVARTGRVTVITGDSGAGKSTLLRILAGDRPPEQLWIEVHPGEEAEPIPLTDFLGEPTRMAYLPQQSILREELTPRAALDYWLNILTASYAKDSDFKQQTETARDELIRELFDEQEAAALFADQGAPKIHRLSGGQQRRLDVILSLCSPAELVLLDEPDTGLDPARRKKLFETLTRFAARYGKIIIAVSHYAAEVFDASEIDTWETRREDESRGAVRMQARESDKDHALNLHPAPDERYNRILDQFLLYVKQFGAQLRGGGAWIYLLAPILFTGLIRMAVHIDDPEAVFSPPARTLLFFYAVTCYWLGLVQTTGFWVGNGVLFLRECRQGASVCAYLVGFLKVYGLLLLVEAALAAVALKLGSGLTLGLGWIALFGILAAWNGCVGGLLWATLQHYFLPGKTSAVTAQLIALFLTLSAIVFSYPVIGTNTYLELSGEKVEHRVRSCNRLGLLKSMQARKSDPRMPAVLLAELPIAANPSFHGLWFQGEYPKRESATLYDQCRRHAVPELLYTWLSWLISVGIILFIAKRMSRLHIE